MAKYRLVEVIAVTAVLLLVIVNSDVGAASLKFLGLEVDIAKQSSLIPTLEKLAPHSREAAEIRRLQKKWSGPWGQIPVAISWEAALPAGTVAVCTASVLYQEDLVIGYGDGNALPALIRAKATRANSCTPDAARMEAIELLIGLADAEKLFAGRELPPTPQAGFAHIVLEPLVPNQPVSS